MRARALPRGPILRPTFAHAGLSTVAAAALLLQALFAAPLALRMAADAVLWLQFDIRLCAATPDATSADAQHRPARQLPTPHHAECLICQAHALPLGLLVAVATVLVALCGGITSRCRSPAGLPWRRSRRHSYYSRAPPLAA